MSHQEPTIATILRLLAAEYDGPVEERRVLEQVLERRPSSAKNPYATIRERLRWDGLMLGWLRLNRRELIPLRIAMHGLRFRCVPRACDVEAGLLPLAHLQPFAGLRGADLTLRDPAGRPMALVEPTEAERGGLSMPSFDLGAWYARERFAPGDSILVTAVSADPLTLQIEREGAAEFRPAAVASQDAELLDAIVEKVSRSNVALLPCDEVVLPVFAAAGWRTGYPGSPWQLLVTRDGRLQLVDDIFLTSQRHPSLRLFSSDEVFEPLPAAEPDRQAADSALLAEIDSLQRELQRSREQDATAGIWDGRVQRASAALGSGERYGDGPGGIGGLVDDLDDDWPEPDMFGLDDDEDDAELRAAEGRMLSLLPPETVARLQQARPEEAELIIAENLNLLLSRDLSLFPRLEPAPPTSQSVGDLSADAIADDGWELSLDDDDEDWVGEIDDALEGEGDSEGVYAQSGELISRFHDYLAELGKSSATARARARALRVYADFLASYYGRTLAEGDYATLDECLFFYYPRRVLNTSPRQVREICTAIKQFYRFLRERGSSADDRFAAALWRRREQAARVVEIYERIASDSPSFELLFERLFRPYTE